MSYTGLFNKKVSAWFIQWGYYLAGLLVFICLNPANQLIAGTSYTNDILGLSQVLVSDGEAGQFYNLFGLDLISQQTLSQTRTLLPDGLGSVRTEMVGSAIHTLTTYEPFGKVFAQTGSSGTTYGFTGEQFDSTTNLQYLRARYYSPSLKIFLSRDPFPGSAVLSQSQHSYAYVHNNPVNLTDPSGSCVFFGIDTLICLGAGIGFISSYAIQTIVNMTNGMDLLEAIYHENIDETQVVASTAAGGISGALTPLIPAGATWAGVLGYGALDGAANGFLEQFLLNLLLCRDWNEGILNTTASGAIAGAATGGILHGVGRAVSGIINSFDGSLSPWLRGLNQPTDLLEELARNGVKHTPERIVGIEKMPNGRIVFLEIGNPQAGLQHILVEHGDDFARKGMLTEQIPNILFEALRNNKIVGYQGAGHARPIYEIVFNGKTQHIAITVGSNGFIVGANPVSLR